MSERILLEYQKTIPKSLRIITNISHTGFFKELEELSDDKIANFFNENLLKVPIPNVFSKNHTESDKYSMKMAYDNKQLIKHKISDLQKIHSLQIISMDEKYVYGLYCKNPIQSTIIIYFDTYKILCPLKNCHIYNPINKILTYRDGNHLTIEGSLILKKDFDIFLNNNSKLFN